MAKTKTRKSTSTSTSSGAGWMSKEQYHQQANQLKGEIRAIKIEVLKEEKRGQTEKLRGTTAKADGTKTWADRMEVWRDRQSIQYETEVEKKAIDQLNLSATRRKTAVKTAEWEDTLGELNLSDLAKV